MLYCTVALWAKLLTWQYRVSITLFTIPFWCLLVTLLSCQKKIYIVCDIDWSEFFWSCFPLMINRSWFMSASDSCPLTLSSERFKGFDDDSEDIMIMMPECFCCCSKNLTFSHNIMHQTKAYKSICEGIIRSYLIFIS